MSVLDVVPLVKNNMACLASVDNLKILNDNLSIPGWLGRYS
jgi:hypothetical protein